MTTPATSLLSNRILDPATIAGLDDEQLDALTQATRQEAYVRINERCSRLDVDERGWAKETSGPLFWGQNFTRTENPHWKEQGLPFKAPFPKKSYFRPLVGVMMTEPRLFIPKTRELLTSWAAMVYGTHKAQWHQGEVIVQTENEEKAKRLIHYATCLYENQDPELKALNPLAGKPSQLSIEWASGGRVFGIPAGENKIRMFHPTLYVQDESSFLPEAQQCYDAAAPVTQQIIAISSAGPGWFGDECQAPAATAQDQAEIMAEIENTVANKYPYPIDRKDFDQLSETQRAEWMRNGAPRKR